MKITIVQDGLIFHDAENEELKELLYNMELKGKLFKEKLHVYATRDELFFILWKLSQDNDIELI